MNFTLSLIISLIVCFSTDNSFAYDREDWPHWIKSSGTCLNTRQEILRSRSLTSVIFKGKKGCAVDTGKWDDFYYPETLTRSSDIDIDHVIPLKYADDLGGSRWSREAKQKFANDPDNLVITNKKFNRQKGAKGITQWLPVNRQYACRYMNRWFAVKNKYKLPISNEEKHTYLLAKCQ